MKSKNNWLTTLTATIRTTVLVSFSFNQRFQKQLYISSSQSIPFSSISIWFYFSDGSNSKSGSTSIEKIPEKETIQSNGSSDQSIAKKKSSIESLHLIESSSKQVNNYLQFHWNVPNKTKLVYRCDKKLFKICQTCVDDYWWNKRMTLRSREAKKLNLERSTWIS